MNLRNKRRFWLRMVSDSHTKNLIKNAKTDEQLSAIGRAIVEAEFVNNPQTYIQVEPGKWRQRSEASENG